MGTTFNPSEINEERTPEETLTGEVGFFDILAIAARRNRLLLGLTLLGGFLGLIFTLIWPKTYAANVRVLPVQRANSTASAMLSQLSSLGPLGALAGNDLGLKNPAEMAQALLESRSVADPIIQRFKLQDVYGTKLASETRKKFQKHLTVNLEKDGTITVQVEDRDPQRAANIANDMIDEVYKLAHRMATSEASQRKDFFDGQVLAASDALASAETSLKETEERTGMIKVDSQAEAVISAIAGIRAQIATREVALSAMQQYATEQNPELIRMKREVSSLQAQLENLTRRAGGSEGDVIVPTGKVPEASLEYLRKYREFKYREAVYELLLKQLEAARFDELRPPIPVEVIDAAVIPDKPVFPRLILMVPIGAAVGFALAIICILGIEINQQNPTVKKKSRLIISYLRT